MKCHGIRGDWQALPDADSAGDFQRIALDVASRMADPGEVERSSRAAASQTAFPRSVRWEPHGIAQGDAGLAVFFDYVDRCFPDRGWALTARLYLERAARSLERSSYVPAGMFAGLSGVAFATWLMSRRGSRYPRLLETIEEALVPIACEESGKVHGLAGVPVGAFDVISGISGIGAYCLNRLDQGPVANALEKVLRSLIVLTREDLGLPRWRTPPQMIYDQQAAKQYPHGYLNCGLAHGIPGPLALLSLAHMNGLRIDGLEDAIARAAAWLARHRVDDAWGVNWPTVVPLRAHASPDDTPSRGVDFASLPPSRTAWCYGSPGVARSLWLAGRALGGGEYCEMAVAALKAALRKPAAQRNIESPTFCHGVAGLLQITLRFARDTGQPEFREGALALCHQLSQAFDPNSRLGFSSHEPGGRQVDQPGLLDGAPGVSMALLSASTDCEPAWDRLFLLS